MRRVRYVVAMSLDGYIAGPNGEADWIIMDPDIDFGAMFERFDTFLMGRRTFERTGSGAGGTTPGLLGGGIPLLPPPADRAALALTGHKVYPKSGTVGLEYAVRGAGGAA